MGRLEFYAWSKCVRRTQLVGVDGGSWRMAMLENLENSADLSGFKSPSSHLFHPIFPRRARFGRRDREEPTVSRLVQEPIATSRPSVLAARCYVAGVRAVPGIPAARAGQSTSDGLVSHGKAPQSSPPRLR